MPTLWSDLCAHGEWQCYDPRHWLCTMSPTLHRFTVVGGSVSVCETCGKTEEFLSRTINERLNGRES